MFDQQKQQQNSRLGNILLKRLCVTQQQLDAALIYQQKHHLRLGEALMDMKLINKKQLDSALRKQSWLRVVTTCLSLTLAPFSPAFASTQGKVGASSTATSQISLTILPETVNNKNSDVQFTNSDKSQISSGFCTSNFNTDLYNISAKGSGEGGLFVLQNGIKEDLYYDVSYQYQGQAFEKMEVSKGLSFANDNTQTNAAKNCMNAGSNRLKISIKDTDNQSSQSNYAGTVTITIAAE